MHFMLFGHTSNPVMQLLPQLGLRRDRSGNYRANAVPELLAQAVQSGIVYPPPSTDTDARLTERVVIFESADVQRIEQLARSCVPMYQHAIAAALPLIADRYGQTSAAHRGITWEQVLHLLVIGWLMDLCVPLALRPYGYTEFIDGWQVVGYASYPKDTRGCGVRLYPGLSGMFGELWVSQARRTPHLPLNLTPNEVECLVRLSQNQPVDDHAALRKLCYFGVVHRNTVGWALSIPVFDPADQSVLLPPMLETAQHIAGHLNTAVIEQAQTYQPGRLYHLAWMRLVLTLGLEALLRDGILPVVPGHVPRPWGLWLTIGPDRSLLFHPFRTQA